MVALESLRKLNEQIFVPGHGALCDQGYLDEQGSFIQEWKDYVKDGIDRGMTKDEAVADLTKMTGRYPMDVGQDGMAPHVMRMNAGNLYDYLTGAITQPAAIPPSAFARAIKTPVRAQHAVPHRDSPKIICLRRTVQSPSLRRRGKGGYASSEATPVVPLRRGTDLAHTWPFRPRLATSCPFPGRPGIPSPPG